MMPSVGESDRLYIYQLTNYAFQMRSRCTVIRFVSSSTKFGLCTLQRQNTEISKQIFPEKEYRHLSPNSCVCERFIYSYDWSAYSAGGNM
jgi:hypothetical protein